MMKKTTTPSELPPTEMNNNNNASSQARKGCCGNDCTSAESGDGSKPARGRVVAQERRAAQQRLFVPAAHAAVHDHAAAPSLSLITRQICLSVLCFVAVVVVLVVPSVLLDNLHNVFVCKLVVLAAPLGVMLHRRAPHNRTVAMCTQTNGDVKR